MSQAKVDKYKEEKKNRSKTIKMNRVKKAIGICIACLVAGAAIGVPVGKFAYAKHLDEIKKNATVKTTDLDSWFDKYFVGNYSDFFQGFSVDEASNTDASNTDATETDTAE